MFNLAINISRNRGTFTDEFAYINFSEKEPAFDYDRRDFV
jgi:hypothetical protein